LARIALLEKPFDQEAGEARAAAEAIDQKALVQREIERITPGGDELRQAIREAFSSDKPMWRWLHVLHGIADETDVSSPDDDAEAAP
jgi:hypothetical protein